MIYLIISAMLGCGSHSEEPGSADFGSAPPPAAPTKGNASRERLESPMMDLIQEEARIDLDKPESVVENATESNTRAWFPETFLFEPLVVTNEAGNATVGVTIPDRLTTWRVLGLAHGKNGAQAGTATSFLGTLPVYVDPVAPPFLREGDTLRLPIQVVNTTESDIREPLRVQAIGATLVAPAPGTIAVDARSSTVENYGIIADRPGVARLVASIGDADTIERTIPILPTGRPLQVSRSGTLAAPRNLNLVGPHDLDPKSARARLMVYPGALAILRAELENAGGRDTPEDDAYALLLSGQAPSLLTNLGETPDQDALRTLSLVSTQRVVRHARMPDVMTAALLAEAALSHPDNPVLLRMGERLTQQLISNQRPDGTFAGGDGWTLQRMLVATADATRSVHRTGNIVGNPRLSQQAQLVQLKASGAFERFANQADDPYTAAAILASGGADVALTERLQKRIRDAIVVQRDGSRILPVPQGALRADGQPPTQVEATALAVLALEGDPEAEPWLTDMGSSILSYYQPILGWGDGRTNLVCLQALLQVFDEPLPESINITLSLDGNVVTEGVLSGTRLRDLLVLEAPTPNAAGEHRWTVTADPAVAGLGFSLELQTWVPWAKSTEMEGLELSIEMPQRISLGTPGDITVMAVAPAGDPLIITQQLPAGVQVDESSLVELKDNGLISSYTIDDKTLSITGEPLRPGQTLQVTYRVIPTLAGTLHTGPATLALKENPQLTVSLPPVVWNIYR